MAPIGQGKQLTQHVKQLNYPWDMEQMVYKYLLLMKEMVKNVDQTRGTGGPQPTIFPRANKRFLPLCELSRKWSEYFHQNIHQSNDRNTFNWCTVGFRYQVGDPNIKLII